MSTDPDKQRKRAAQRPQHEKQKKLAAHLAEDLLLEFDTRSVPVREGDTVEIMRGDFAGTKGTVLEVDPDETTITVEGATQSTAEEQKVPKPIHPSNVRITDLNLTDPWRARKLGTEVQEPEPEPEPDLEAEEPEPEPEAETEDLETTEPETEPETEVEEPEPEPETEVEEPEPEADEAEPEPEADEATEAETEPAEPETEADEGPEPEADEAGSADDTADDDEEVTS